MMLQVIFHSSLERGKKRASDVVKSDVLLKKINRKTSWCVQVMPCSKWKQGKHEACQLTKCDSSGNEKAVDNNFVFYLSSFALNRKQFSPIQRLSLVSCFVLIPALSFFFDHYYLMNLYQQLIAETHDVLLHATLIYRSKPNRMESELIKNIQFMTDIRSEFVWKVCYA